MKHLLTLLVLVGCVASVSAARISEPGTTFYGRVLTRVGDREFPISEGEIKWTLVVAAQGNRQYELKTRLQPIADGLYAYKLTIPHQALAFDLTVTDQHVPLTAAGWRYRHLEVLVNGKPARLMVPATDDFTASQATRAATHRIDLEVPDLSLDSDGDGVPDWWEDSHGTDKWNPHDAPLIGNGLGGGGGAGSGAFTGRTFAEWRQHFFPGLTSDLRAFAQEDGDADGTPNLVEYAFDLDPRLADTAAAADRLPYPRLVDGVFGVVFIRRPAATDLEYQLETSQDLVQWSAPTEGVVETVLTGDEAAPGRTCLSVTGASDDGSKLFLRIRVRLK